MVSNEFSCIGKGFKHFIGLICGEKKIMYTTSKKCVEMQNVLMKLSECRFWLKTKSFLIKFGIK